jgi:two-component system sensor histidine kinase KdpD
MTRLEAGVLTMHTELSDLQDVIGAALAYLGSRLQERTVQVDVAPGMPLTPLDFVPIVHVLVNLLDNALKYSPPGQPIEISARASGQEALIEVADRGPGIPPEDIERIFDRFYRVQRPGIVSGTGLGLSICHGIVEAHGGNIRAQNRPGGGVSFIIALPLRSAGNG